MKKVFTATICSLFYSTPVFAHEIGTTHEHLEIIAFGALIALSIIVIVLCSKNKQQNDDAND